MENNKEIKLQGDVLDFVGVPGWYVLCNNSQCPLRSDCLRFLAAEQAPETLEIANCVMPRTLKGNACRWYDKKTTITYAAGS